MTTSKNIDNLSGIMIKIKSLVVDKFFKKITIIYPVPDHSQIATEILKLLRKSERKCQNMSNFENPNNRFKVFYINYSLNNDLSGDKHEIVKVFEFKNLMYEYLKPNLEYLIDFRSNEFTELNTKISLDLRKKPEIELKLVKKNKNISGFTKLYSNLNIAYNDFLPIKEKNITQKLF